MATYPVIRLLIAGLVTVSAFGHAQTPPPAYQLAAYNEGVPVAVLYAVALQESGIQLGTGIGVRPWPWTLNISGTGYRYSTRLEACEAMKTAIGKVGAKRVDVGLGQINIGWNGHHFKVPCDALDPYLNLSITARILKSHYDKLGDWMKAVGRYHRPAGGQKAQKYRDQVEAHLSNILKSHDGTALQAVNLIWVNPE